MSLIKLYYPFKFLSLTIQIWRDAFRIKQKSPYMNNLFPGCAVRGVEFCPFEDVLGVGHSKGFTSLLIPGDVPLFFAAFSYEQNRYFTAEVAARSRRGHLQHRS